MANTKSGVRYSAKGYKQVLCKGHHRADPSGYVFEHILIWEQNTGVPVPANCVIHHLNGNKTDNRIENLCLMDRGAHTAFHNTGRSHSTETKKKMSEKAKSWLAYKENHPSFKPVDVQALEKMRGQGVTVSDICKVFGISRSTYYEKIKEKKVC